VSERGNFLLQWAEISSRALLAVGPNCPFHGKQAGAGQAESGRPEKSDGRETEFDFPLASPRRMKVHSAGFAVQNCVQERPSGHADSPALHPHWQVAAAVQRARLAPASACKRGESKSGRILRAKKQAKTK